MVTSVAPSAAALLRRSFSAAVSPADAWSVLSDYDGISSFIPSMKESRVLERRGGHVLVEQRALGKFLFFTRTARVLLLVRENPPGMIAFEDILHYDFEYYRGSWSVERSGGDSRVVYRLEAKRKFPAPEFIAGRIMRRNAEDLLQEVRAEMLRRSRAKGLA